MASLTRSRPTKTGRTEVNAEKNRQAARIILADPKRYPRPDAGMGAPGTHGARTEGSMTLPKVTLRDEMLHAEFAARAVAEGFEHARAVAASDPAAGELRVAEVRRLAVDLDALLAFARQIRGNQ
jgi:hypothetical protein